MMYAGTILILLQNPELRQELVALLTPEGHRPTFATGGEEGLRLAVQHLPDLVVLEPHLSDLDGFQVCRRIRADPRLACGSILLLAAHDDREALEKGLEAGVDDLARYPFEPLELRRRVLTLVKLSRSRRQLQERGRYEAALLEKQRALDQLASHDQLTGLKNRRWLEDHLRQLLARADEEGRPAALLLLDLNRFRHINDILGYAAGDRLLQAVARRLEDATQGRWPVARLGGNEFAVVLEGAGGAESAELARKLIDAVTGAFRLDRHELYLGAQAGIGLFPRDGVDADTLIQNADIALQLARDSGQGSCRFFSGEANGRAMRKLRLEAGLRRALERGELSLAYQPQVELRSGRIVGAEALLRWTSLELGPVSPVEFIPLAEETGLIVPIGAWVLRTACEQTAAWHQAGLAPIRIAVNLSVRQFRQQNVAHAVKTVLEETGLAPTALELELTESLMLASGDAAVDLLNELKEQGVSLSIDDFGTGYSSLAYLRRLPIDHLKVAQEFVRDIPADQATAAIASTVVSLAHSLGLRVIAEGVETPAHVEFFRALDCDLVQGYHFSRPLEARAMTDLLRERMEIPGIRDPDGLYGP